MSRARFGTTPLIALMALALACGGAAAPTSTPASRPVATTAPAAVATPTSAATAAVTPTPTRASATTIPTTKGPIGKMTMAAVADITNRDIHVATAGGLTQFFQVTDVNAALVALQRTGKGAEPYLTESWSWDEKGRKVRYVIRQGARFHDGKPVTSDDILFTVEKVRSPYAARGTNSGLPLYIKNVEAIDDRTVVFTLSEVFALGWSTVGGLVTQPRHDPYQAMQKNPIGAGPYRLVEWRPFESITLEASPYWWNADAVQVKTIVRLAVPEPESRLAMLKSGQIDFMDEVQPRQAEELLKDNRFVVKTVDAGVSASLIFATDRATIPGTDLPNPFLDVRVRRAFIMALDRKAIFEGVALGRYGRYVPGPWQRCVAGGSMEDKITPYPYDPKEARRLLEEAKFPFDLETPFWVYRTIAGFAEAAEVAVVQWNSIGIKARFRLTEVGTLLAYWQEKPSRTYPLEFIRGNITSDGEPGTNQVSDSRTPEGRISQVHNDDMLERIIRLRTAFEPAEREAIFQEIYRIQHEQAVQIRQGASSLSAVHAAIDQSSDKLDYARPLLNNRRPAYPRQGQS